MKPIISLFIFFFCLHLSARDHEVNFKSQEDTIVLENSNKYGLFYIHVFKPKQTLFSITRLFGSNPEEVYSFNPTLKNKSIRIGETVIIPVRSKIIITHKEDLMSGEEYSPVYYKVRPKDNLFRIARQLFFQPIQDLMDKNNLSSYSLKDGTLLHVGWINLEHKDPFIAQEENRDSVNLLRKNRIYIQEESKDDDASDSIEVESPVEIVNMILKRGTAVWNKENPDKDNLFVLHPTARINSIIELFNPMLNRKVYAEVIGRMPSHIYPRDVNLVVSPLVAEKLGIVDIRFLIEMRYIE